MGRPAVELPHAYAAEIRLLYRTAMVVFLVTVGIGILNGLDVAAFGRDTILTHVHAGDGHEHPGGAGRRVAPVDLVRTLAG